MCGICGFTGQIENKTNLIQQMTDIITHRGPDQEGFYTDDYIAMGFRRLAIIDLDTGNQPLYNEDHNLVLTFNGEIYNYKELRKELISKGHRFITDSDSEVIVHGFEEWDEEVVDKLRGMFAFAIYNIDTKALFIARDPFGIKPMHYTVINDNLCYGSEIKSILEHPSYEKEFNEKALDAYLSFQYCPQPMTFFKNIYCLLPGHFLWFRDGVVETQRYFEAKFKPKNDMTEEEAVEEIDKAFTNSIEAHKISDVEVGCFLSSGVDSSYVASYFREQKTFTVGFDFGEKYDETYYAEELAKELHTEHTSKIISSEEFWAAIPKVQYHMDQPLADPSCIALYFVAKAASEKVKVVLSGEGADELFGGYTCYNDPRVFKWYQKLVFYPVRKFIAWICRKIPDIKGRDYLLRATHPIEKRYIGNAYMYDLRQKKQLLKDSNLATDPSRLCRRLYTRARRYDDETKMQYVDINTWLIGDILLKADRMSMANSLELRVPFLDKEVYKIASSLPTDLRINKLNTKYAMRLAAGMHLPEDVAQRTKLGFPVPTRVWLRDEHYYSIVKEAITSPTARKFFNVNILVNLLDEHFIEKEDHSRKIWTIYSFVIWYEIYFGKVNFEDLPDDEQERMLKAERKNNNINAEVFEEINVNQEIKESPFEDEMPTGGSEKVISSKDEEIFSNTSETKKEDSTQEILMFNSENDSYELDDADELFKSLKDKLKAEENFDDQ